jgi:plasmid stabilization system protein ParE
MRLIWSLQAIEDVEAIRTYVTRDSEQYANPLIDRIIAAVDRPEGFPLSGRVVPEVGDESLREVINRNYRIVYRLKPEIIEIVTVFHAARLLRLE